MRLSGSSKSFQLSTIIRASMGDLKRIKILSISGPGTLARSCISSAIFRLACFSVPAGNSGSSGAGCVDPGSSTVELVGPGVGAVHLMAARKQVQEALKGIDL